MSFIAILNTRSNLRRLLAQGERPAVVATWSSAVFEEAERHGIPVLHEDTVISQPDRIALHDRAEDLARQIAGDTVPTGRRYDEWCWWAMEFVFTFALSHAYRTRRLLDACAELVPDYRAVVHDREGYGQGAVINFLVRNEEKQTFGFHPHTAERDTLHQRLDVIAMPELKENARDIWQGKRLPKDSRPGVVLLHTNEVAHIVGHLSELGTPWFCLLEDARKLWPEMYKGPRVDARPAGRPNPLIETPFPEWVTMETEPWERELCELLAFLWQSHLREEYGWARAAYEAANVRLLLGGGLIFPDLRARVLALKDIGGNVALVQHGMLHARHGGRGERVQHFADHQLCWSRLSATDIGSWMTGSEFHVAGWPQSAVDRARDARAQHKHAPLNPVIGDQGPWVILTSAPLPDEPYGWGETFLRHALDTIRKVDPVGRIVIKHHPFQEPAEIILTLCEAWDHPDVEVVGGLDPWEVVKDARAVVAFKSTAVHCAVHLKRPVVVYHPSEHDAMFDRFPGFPVVRTPEALEAALRTGLAGGDYAAARVYARTDVNAGVRAVAILRRILHGAPAVRRRQRRGAARSAA